MRKSEIANTCLPYPQTIETANNWFFIHGVTKTEWAKAHGLSRTIVADILRGRVKGTFGRAHHAAIALGLKQNPELE